jgi:hypothetical protein
MHRTVIGLFIVAIVVALSVASGPRSLVDADPQTEVPAGVLRFLGGGEGDPNAFYADPTPEIPEGVLRFLGGGEGDPDAFASAVRATPTPTSAAPPGYLTFFGNHPYGTPTSVSTS